VVWASCLIARLPLAPILDDLGLWIGAAILLGLGMLAYQLHALLVQARRVERGLGKLDGLTKVGAVLDKMVEGQQGLDLRRLEHVLIDIRDGQRRVEERLLALVESLQTTRDAPGARAGSSERSNGTAPAPGSGLALSERIVGRLLALGFERIEIVTPVDILEHLAESDGDVQVEARRNGASHKGRVVLRGGNIADVQMRASYEIFP